MNKQEVIQKINDSKFCSKTIPLTYQSECFNQGMDAALKIISKLDEPQKVKVPTVVFKFLNDNEQLSKQEKLAYLIRSKDGDQFYLTEMLPCDGIITDSDGDELFSWVEKQSHETLLNIWKYGYEVEEEPYWTIGFENKYLQDIQFKKGLHNLVEPSGVWGTKNRAINFKSERDAEKFLFLTGGTIEKV